MIESDVANPLEALVGYHLRRASGAMMADLAVRLEALSLRPTEASVLVIIDANPAIIQSDIGRVLSIKRANMAPLIAGLIDRSLARRDIFGRAHALFLTTAGQDLVAKARTIMHEHETAFLGDLSAADRKRWNDRLETVWTRMPTATRATRPDDDTADIGAPHKAASAASKLHRRPSGA